MSNDPNPHDWQPCSPGEISSLAARLDREHRREQMSTVLRTSTMVATLVLVASLAIVWRSEMMKPGGITCKECGAQFTAYHDHLAGITPMDNAKAESMQAHLKGCPHCLEMFKQRFPNVVVEHLHSSGQLLANREVQVPLAMLGW